MPAVILVVLAVIPPSVPVFIIFRILAIPSVLFSICVSFPLAVAALVRLPVDVVSIVAAIVIAGGFQQLRKFVEAEQVVTIGIAAVEPVGRSLLVLAGHRFLPVLLPVVVEVIDEFLQAQIAVVVRVHVVHHLLWVGIVIIAAIVTKAAQHGPDAVDEALHLVDVNQVVAVIVAIIEQSCNLFRIEFGVRWVGPPGVLELLVAHVAVTVGVYLRHGLLGGRGAVIIAAIVRLVRAIATVVPAVVDQVPRDLVSVVAVERVIVVIVIIVPVVLGHTLDVEIDWYRGPR